MKTTNDLRVIFNQLEDPRSDINKLHKLEDILLIGVISVICAADTWKNMETYAKAKEGFLRTFLELPYGILEFTLYWIVSLQALVKCDVKTRYPALYMYPYRF